MSSIKALTQKIEAEQIRKLQELSSSGSGGQSADNFLSFGGQPASPSVGSESDFERLVFGKKDVPQHDGFAWQAPVSSNGINTPAPAPAPAPARAISPQPVTTAGAQKFAWSTPSPTVPMPPVPSMGSVLAPTGMPPPLQPSTATAGFGSTTAFRTQPSPAPQSTATSSSGIDWSAAAKSKPSFPANGGMNATPPSMNQMFGATTSTPAFGGATTSTPAFGGATTSTTPAFGGIKKGGGIQLTNFGNPMMSTTTTTSTPLSNSFGGMNNTGTFSIGTPQKQEPKKQGLDAWESLI
jgi:SCY1-like protein 2